MRTLLFYLINICCLSVFAQAEPLLPDVGEIYKSGAKNPKDAAVVIAIEDYPILGGDYAVTYATRDGDGIENFLIYTRGVPSERVRRLDMPTVDSILEAVKNAANQVEKGGTLWVYFAGHSGVEPITKDRVLLPYNIGTNSNLQREAVSLNALQKLGQNSNADSVIIILDACNVLLSKGNRFVAPASLAAEPKVSVWSAASENQLSGPFEPVQHGAFTYALLGALRGWADGEVDGERDGQVNAKEATQYVRSFLHKIQVTGQIPDFIGDFDLVLSQGKETPPTEEAIVSARRSALKKTAKTQAVTEVAEGYNPHTNRVLRNTGIALTAVGGLGILAGISSLIVGTVQDSVDEFSFNWLKIELNDGSTAKTVGTYSLAIGGGVALIGGALWVISSYRNAKYNQGQSYYVVPTGNGMTVGGRW